MNLNERLCFRSKDHMRHVSKVLKSLQQEEVHCDVSLVTDDGYVLKAHQAILASTSSYFSRVLSNLSADQHPIIVLSGASLCQVSCLLDYMYEGNIKVEQDVLDNLLEVADSLEVKGLCQIRANTSIQKLLTSYSSSSSCEHPCYASPDIPSNGSNKETAHLFSTDNSNDLELDITTTSSSCRLDISTEQANLITPCRFTSLPVVDNRDLSCTETRSHNHGSFEDFHADDQISGMDLTLAKTEPWSPRETSSAKRKKIESPHLDSSTMYATSDTEWDKADKHSENPARKKLCIPKSGENTASSSSVIKEEQDTHFQNFTNFCNISGAHEDREESSFGENYVATTAHNEKNLSILSDFNFFPSDNEESLSATATNYQENLSAFIDNDGSSVAACQPNLETKIEFDSGCIIQKSQDVSVYPVNITKVQFGNDIPNNRSARPEPRLARVHRTIKGPKNSFFIFCEEERPKMKVMYPGEGPSTTIKRLSEKWKGMVDEEKESYRERARLQREEHRLKYPNYKEIRESYREEEERYKQKKLAKSEQFMVVP